MRPDDFIAAVKDAALAASKVSGLPAGVTIAQAAVESAWGSKIPGNNFFGITISGDLPNVALPTHEELTPEQLANEIAKHRILKALNDGLPIKGSKHRLYKVLRYFGAWSSMQKNFEARDRILISEPRYDACCKAWFDDKNIEAHIRGLAPWATAHTYTDTIWAIVRSHDLGGL